MTYNVYLEYPNGERKLKGKCRLQETADYAVENYEKFFDREGVTRSPGGLGFDARSVRVFWVEE